MKALSTFWDDILVYLVTLLGVITSQYIPAFKAHEAFDISTRWANFAVGAVIALWVVLRSEVASFGVDPIVVKKGKRDNLARRLEHALGQGMIWATLSS